VPRLCEAYSGICLTTEGKARKTLSQGSRRMPVGKKYTEQSIYGDLSIVFFSRVGLRTYQHTVHLDGQLFL
jgi:hypothetical protein